MVGVAGRSRGCITCRRRRVKCDLRAPHCKRCSKGGKTCEGYEPYRAFVNTFFDNYSDHNPHEVDWVKLDGAQRYEFVFENDAARSQHPFTNYSTFKSSIQLGLWDCHVLKRLFEKQPCGKTRPWVQLSLGSNKTTVGRDAILALAQVLSANDHGHQNDAAAAQYNRAISLLHKNLADDEGKDDLDNLAAINMFYYYEMTSASHADGWSFHAAGMARFVELRGPESFQNGPAKALFLHCRFKIIYQALLLRKHTFLEETEWKTVPWQGCPKSHLHVLQDIYADLPGLFADGDALCSECCSSPSSDSSVAMSMHIQRLIETFHRLISWRQRWERTFPSAITHIKASADSNLQHFSSAEVSTSTVYWYESSERASDLVFFYGTLLYLFDEMTEWLGTNAVALALGSLPPCNELSPNGLLTFQPGLTRAHICSEIYRSLDYLLDGSDTISGSIQAVFPLHACGSKVDYLTNNPVPLPIWDKVCDLSGFQMIHPLRGDKTVLASTGPSEPPEGSIIVDATDCHVLDPALNSALRDSPMQDDSPPLFTFREDDDEDFMSMIGCMRE